MAKIRGAVVSGSIEEIIGLVNKKNFSAEELVVLISQLMIRCGFSIYYEIDKPLEPRPEKVDVSFVEKLFEAEKTTGSVLMKLGFDMRKVLLGVVEEVERKENR